MEISVLGCGRWGSFIAWYLDKIGHSITLYGRETSHNMVQLKNTRSNGTITLNNNIKLETNISNALVSNIIVISIDSQSLRNLMEEIKTYDLIGKNFVLCMKGIEISTGKRLTEVVNDYFKSTCSVAVWLGPGHVEEFYQGVPNCMVLDSDEENLKQDLINAFSSDLIRFYYGDDLIGNEIGAASKNVIGVAAGILDGLGVSSLKGALMARGTREISRLISAMGGNELSAYGLCHLGDYEATVFSEYSHNRRYGESIITGESYDKLAEGYYTVKALYDIGIKYNIDLPICFAVYDILYYGEDPKLSLDKLFLRSIKKEF